MKILIVSSRYYPETFSVTRIAEQLSAMGNDVTVLTGRPHYGKCKIYDGYDKTKSEVINHVKVIRVKEHIRKKSTFSLILNYLSIYFRFKSKMKKIGNYDVVISHVISPILSIRGVPKYCKKHNVPHIHYGLDLWPESLIASEYAKRNSFIFNFFKHLSIKIYKSCDCICFASPSVETYFSDYLGLKVPFKQIYQPTLINKPSIDLLSHEYFFDSKIKILYCGSVVHFNHLDLFINSLSSFAEKDKIEFNIVGSGSEIDNLKKLVAEHELGNIVKFHGRVSAEETVKHYLNSDFLFVSLFDNSYTSKMIPQKVLEYFMYGRPIIGMIKGDGANLISQASSKNILADQNVESLKEMLSKLLLYSPDDCEKCGIDNRNFFDKNSRFTIECVCNELLDTCNEYRNKKKA